MKTKIDGEYYNSQLKSLHEDQDSFNRIKIFRYDLRHYGNKEEIQKRLEHDLTTELYLSSVYFTLMKYQEYYIFLINFSTIRSYFFRNKKRYYMYFS